LTSKERIRKKLAKRIKIDTKSFYAYVCSKTKTRDVIGPLRDVSGNLVSDDAAMCDVLNSYFGSVFTKVHVDSNAPEAKLRFGMDECDMLKDAEISSNYT